MTRAPWQDAEDNAPIGDPETEEERRMVADAREEFARTGKTYSPREIKQAIELMRQRQERG